MEDLLQQNLLYLFQHHKDTFNKIQQYMDNHQEKNSKIVYNDNGSVNLTYSFEDGVKLLYDENEEDLNNWLLENSDLSHGSYDVVMYGLGLSHHLAKLIQLNPNLNYYIYEPEIDIFLEALKVLQIDQLLEHPQIKIFYLGSDIEDAAVFYTLLHTYSEFPKIDVFIPYYAEINIQAIREYFRYNYSFRETEAREYGFEGLFHTLPYRNSIRNLEMMTQSHSLRALKQKFKGYTALIVGAGPSLEPDVEYIKQNRDKLLIISAGSSIQSMLHFGIIPHMSVSMDPGVSNGRVYKDKDLSGVSLVYVPQIYHEITKKTFANKFYAYFNSDPIINYMLPDLDQELVLIANNSVSGTAIQVAAYLGVERIMLAGQDFSFPNDQYYASGASHSNAERRKQKVRSSFLEVDNVSGGVNSTNISMRSALEDIERLIEIIKYKQDIEFINTSSLGAVIKGTEFLPFVEAIKKVEKWCDFQSILSLTESLGDRAQAIDSVDLVELVSRIEGMILDCDKLVDYTKASLRLVEKIEQQARTNPDKAMNGLAKLEQQFAQVTEHRLFKDIIPSWNRSEMKRYDQQVIKIQAEPTMIGKAKLLNTIVVPFMKTINTSFLEMKQEFQQVRDNLNTKKA